jgi:hypothetical protein
MRTAIRIVRIHSAEGAALYYNNIALRLRPIFRGKRAFFISAGTLRVLLIHENLNSLQMKCYNILSKLD